MAHQANYFENLCRVSRAFGTTLKKNELLALIVDTAVEAMNAKAACLFLAGDDPDLYLPAAQKGLSADYPHTVPEKARDHLDELVKKGHLDIFDVAADPRAENRDAKIAEGIASLLVVPVMVHGRPIGVLALYTADRRQFSKTDVAFLTALADQGGIAVDRARLITHIRNNTRLFYDLSAGMNASLDVRQIMTTLTVDLCRVFKAKGVTVQLIDTDGGTLKPVSSSGLHSAFVEEVSGRLEKNVTDAMGGKTVVIQNAASDPGIPDPEVYKMEGIVTVISAPITSGDAVMGVLRLYFADPRDFYDDEILMITAFGHQAGLAIRNATCYIKIENDLKDLQNDIWSHRSWF